MMFTKANGAVRTTQVILVAATVAWTAGVLSIAIAQTDNPGEADERLLECAAIADSAKRVACFDSLVEGLQRGREAPAAASAVAPAEPAEAAAASPVDAAVPAAAGAMESAVEAAPGATGEVANTAPSAESTGSAVPTMPEDEMAHAGAEAQLQEEEEVEVLPIRANVVQAVRSGEYYFIVRLDNGQVWEETDGSRRMSGLPRVGSTVEINKGMFGSYRMKIGNDNRVARVRRLR